MGIKRIITCLDIDNGRVVKGVNFINLKDAGDPVVIAKAYNEQGADEIVLLDINASYEKRGTMLRLVKKVANIVSIPLTVGGGIRTVEDFRQMLEMGADKVSIGSAAVKNPNLILETSRKFGSKKVVIAIDVKKVDDEYHVYIQGGKKDTGLEAISWAREVEKLGAGEILLTSMDADGTKKGYDIEITKKISDAVDIPVIASGGAGKMEDFLEAFTIGGAHAALAASLFHFKEVDIGELKDYLYGEGVNIRRGKGDMELLKEIKFDEKGLIPAIVQDIRTKEVLMMAYMNEESLKKTLETNKTWFWSRSRQELWNKGATSGNIQKVVQVDYDCDGDSLLVLVEQKGVACHTGERSCFYNSIYKTTEEGAVGSEVLEQLYKIIDDRKINPVEGSYTKYLFDKGIDKILKKIGEESAEVIIAAKNPDKEAIVYETSDLIYHLFVLLREKGIPLEDIYKELRSRFK
ncbi:MAG: imidazole glycerol phosphate synthase subunit HisF [Clostridiales bacterium]|nr:imidazole glycerol phosphate synthase subunit HisF [Clostridiales bacterium]